MKIFLGRPKKDSYEQATHFEPKKLYSDGKVPFFTLATFHKGMLREKLKKLVGEASKHDALEVGPGESPIISMLGFKNKTFLDVSHEMAKRYTGKVLTGTLEEFPFKKSKRFGVIVANEVLNHIPPENRVNAVENLAEHAEHLMIVDRPLSFLEKIAALFPVIPRDVSKVDERTIEKTLKRKGFTVEKEYGELDVIKAKIKYFILTAKKLQT